jgi:hypothetical protein
MHPIELDSQTTHGCTMVSRKQKKYSYMNKLHGVEVFVDLEASESCERFNVEKDQ